MKKPFLILISVLFFVSGFCFFANYEISFAQNPLGNVAAGIGNSVGGKAAGASSEDIKTVQAGMNNSQGGTAGTAKSAAPYEGVTKEIFQTMYASVLIWGSKLVTWLAGLAGWIFDEALKFTTVYPTALNDGIYGSWKIVRDFTNIILVFSLLYLGIKTIIEGNGFADKKILIGVIISALLINFSFFFTKDVAFNISNIVGTQIMEQAKMSGGEAKTYSEGFLQIVSPQTILKNPALKGDGSAEHLAANSTWDMLFKMTGQVILLSFVVLTLGVIFVLVSITFIYRLLIFIFLIIFSPIGLISSQIPWIKSLGSDWFKQLKNQVIYFPAFAIILYIVLYIVTELATSNLYSNNNLDVSSSNQLMYFIFRFILIIGFMFGLLILPGKIGAAGADLMTSSGNYLKKKVTNIPRGTVGMASGGVAKAGRYALGNKLANYMGASRGEKDKDRLKALQEKARIPGIGGAMARMQLKSAEKLKEKSFDFRNTKLGASAGLGKGIESYSSAVNSKKKAYEDKMEKDKKLYGFDKVKADKSEILSAEVDRDTKGKIVEETKKEYEREKKAGKTDAELKVIAERLSNEEKELEKAEEKVGELKSKGTTDYIEYLERQRRNVLFVGRRVSRTQKAALEKLKSENRKNWKEDGKYKPNKNKKSKTSTTTVASISSSGGITTI